MNLHTSGDALYYYFLSYYYYYNYLYRTGNCVLGEQGWTALEGCVVGVTCNEPDLDSRRKLDRRLNNLHVTLC